MTALRPATYDRPIEAKLVVRLSNGEEWEATQADLDRFGLVARNDAYMAFNSALTDALTSHGLLDYDADEYRTLTDAEVNPLRYLVETVLCYPDLLDHPEHEGWKSVADVERRLRRVLPPDTDDTADDTAATAAVNP